MALLGIKDFRKNIKRPTKVTRPNQRTESPNGKKSRFFGIFVIIWCERCHGFLILNFQGHKDQKGRYSSQKR